MILSNYPSNYIITSGSGKNPFKLVAFDEALRDAQIADYNLVKISSILPKYCQSTTADTLPTRGSVLLSAFGSVSCNEKGRLIASAVSVAIPDYSNEVGVIMEYSGYFSAQHAEEQVRLMVIEAMKNRGRSIREIQSSAIECECDGNGYDSVISAICIW